MIQRCLAILTKSFRLVAGGIVDIQYLGGLCLSPGPFDQQPLLVMWLGLFIVPMGWTDTNGGKPRSQFPLSPFPPSEFCEGFGRQPDCQLLDRDRLMVRVALQQSRWGCTAEK